MQFDDFDKKIKDAAENHHPAYDEKAWNKMESLLDKHLPVKKDNRRRLIFFLLFLFILGSGAWLFFRNGQTNHTLTATPTKKEIKENIPGTTSRENDNTKSAQQAENKELDQPAVSTKNNNPDNNGESVSPHNNDKDLKNDNKKDPVDKNGNQPAAISSQPGKKHTVIPVPLRITTPPAKNKNAVPYTKKAGSNKVAPDAITGDIVNSPSTTLENGQAITPGKTPGQKVPDDSEPPVDKKTGTTDTSGFSGQKQPLLPGSIQNDTALSATKKDPKKPRQQKESPFAVTVTAGPDLSFVGISELGKVKMKYGAGLSYTYKKFTLRSGFYVTNKIYTASGADYHPYYPDLEKVEGDCKVFEIPVTVSYNFVRAKNYNWFAATGLSSYLMKKETYDYASKDPGTGMTNYWSRTWDNKNKHYFSVLNISAGYERKFSKSVSLIAEPYLQVPLTGIGNGKMKLNSGGLLLTLSVRPFTKR